MEMLKCNYLKTVLRYSTWVNVLSYFPPLFSDCCSWRHTLMLVSCTADRLLLFLHHKQSAHIWNSPVSCMCPDTWTESHCWWYQRAPPQQAAPEHTKTRKEMRFSVEMTEMPGSLHDILVRKLIHTHVRVKKPIFNLNPKQYLMGSLSPNLPLEVNTINNVEVKPVVFYLVHLIPPGPPQAN